MWFADFFGAGCCRKNATVYKDAARTLLCMCFPFHYVNCYDVILYACDADYYNIALYKMAGSSSRKEMGAVSFSLMPFDKVRLWTQSTNFSD